MVALRGRRAGPGPHVHRAHVDAFYVVEGELRFGVDPDVEPVRAPAGTFVLVPPGVVHTFANESDARRAGSTSTRRAPASSPTCAASRTDFDNEDAPADRGRPAADATVVSAGAGERRASRPPLAAILGDAPQLSVLELAFDPGFNVHPHVHANGWTSFFVLDGEVEFTVGERVVNAGPGMWLSVPPGVEHGFRNSGPGPGC